MPAVAAKVANGKLFLEIPLESGEVSKSGKSKVMASSHGNQATGVLIDGKPLIVGINAYVRL